MKPLIAYCCFGAKYARMLGLSLQSLLDLGEYRGDILVVGDLEPAEFAKHCHLHFYPTITYVRVAPTDLLGTRLSRYQLHRYHDTTKYAPVLYIDCDVVFDRPVRHMLAVVASADQICFPTEPDSDIMWDSMGGDLFRDEGLRFKGNGLNSGTFGMPDGGSYRLIVDLEWVAATTADFVTRRRHLFTRWIDQPVVNYIQRRHNRFDTKLLTATLRFCFENDVPSTAVEDRNGAVHFFDGRKAERMQDFLDRISSTRLPQNLLP